MQGEEERGLGTVYCMTCFKSEFISSYGAEVTLKRDGKHEGILGEERFSTYGH